MKAATPTANPKVRERITGAMVQPIKDNSKMDSDLAAEFGNSVNKNTKASM
jgi:hypothetical protein